MNMLQPQITTASTYYGNINTGVGIAVPTSYVPLVSSTDVVINKAGDKYILHVMSSPLETTRDLTGPELIRKLCEHYKISYYPDPSSQIVDLGDL